MNRELLFCSFCLWVLWPMLASVSSSEAQDKLRVGLSSISATSGSIWVAEEKGLFKKHGIDTEVIIIGGGASRVVSSLVAGEIQFSVGGGDAVIRAALRGADTVLAASPLKTGLQRLMVRPDIKTSADLKGKRVGIIRFGSASHWVLQLFLRKWGMRSEDIQIVQLGSSPAMFASLEKEESTARFSRFRHSLSPKSVVTASSPTRSTWTFTICRIQWTRQKAFYAKNATQRCAL